MLLILTNRIRSMGSCTNLGWSAIVCVKKVELQFLRVFFRPRFFSSTALYGRKKKRGFYLLFMVSCLFERRKKSSIFFSLSAVELQIKFSVEG